MLKDPARAVPRMVAKGASVVGADGVRLGMVSALAPDGDDPTHLLVFVAERTRLIPREFPLPVTSIVRVADGVVYVDVTRDGLRSRAGGVSEADGYPG